MLTLPSVVLYGMLLRTVPSTENAGPSLPTCETGTRHVELLADSPGQAPEICIRPGLSLTLFFDTRLVRVDIEGRERFLRVEEAPASLSLVASETLHDGDRVPMTVYFQSGAAPTSATFTLVVHPSQAERQVDISRQERTAASYRQGEQQARAEARQCQEEKARLQAEVGGRGGLTDLILQGWLGEKGVSAKKLARLVARPSSYLETRQIISYRAMGDGREGRIALEVVLFNNGTAPWTPAGATLAGTERGQFMGLKVWPLEPIPPRKKGRLVVEMDAQGQDAQGVFTLELRDEQGREGAIIDGVTFP